MGLYGFKRFWLKEEKGMKEWELSLSWKLYLLKKWQEGVNVECGVDLRWSPAPRYLDVGRYEIPKGARFTPGQVWVRFT